MKKAEMTALQWKAAVELLLIELGRTHTLMAQLYNDPGSMVHTKQIPLMVESNRMIMNAINKRMKGH